MLPPCSAEVAVEIACPPGGATPKQPVNGADVADTPVVPEDNGSEPPKPAKGGPGAGKNLSRAERIARAKKVSGAQQASKKKKG
jgi:YidC/Oxa1 family membrane protein insertase